MFYVLLLNICFNSVYRVIRNNLFYEQMNKQGYKQNIFSHRGLKTTNQQCGFTGRAVFYLSLAQASPVLLTLSYCRVSVEIYFSV